MKSGKVASPALETTLDISLLKHSQDHSNQNLPPKMIIHYRTLSTEYKWQLHSRSI